jgi:integrase
MTSDKAATPKGMTPHPKYPAMRLFKTPNGKSDNWYAKFHHGGKAIRKSMGTTVFAEAVKLAGDWYEDRRYEIRNGKHVPPGGTPFSRLIEPTLEAMRDRRRSARYVKVTKTYLGAKGYIRRFFGSLPVERIDTHTWDEFREWLLRTRREEAKPPLSERSLHQMKNAVYLVLKHARVKRLVSAKPSFEDPYRDAKVDARPRVQFNSFEKELLRLATWENIRTHREGKTRWQEDAQELDDYVNFMLATGMRVGEAAALRVRDVTIVEDDVSLSGDVMRFEICEITVVGGKRGARPRCKSTVEAVYAFRKLLKRRGIKDPTTCEEPLFLKHHRDMFRNLLKANGLYVDEYGRKRDFVSLRHSYICDRLADGASVWDVARNTRTSVTMIENHYARNMPLQGLAINTSRVPTGPEAVPTRGR